MPPERPRRILAMGGGGFTMEPENPALDHFLLTLTDVREPRVLFLPTASGDPKEQEQRFHMVYDGRPCATTVLSLFRLHEQPVALRELILEQDLVYVGGGSMRNLLAIWREHGLDRLLAEAWRRGTVLAGLSAGAMCWCAGGVTKSGGAAAPIDGLGLLPFSLSVHRDGDPDRLPAYRAAVRDGALPPGYAVDDYVGLLFEDDRLVRAVASRPGHGAARVDADGSEHELEVELLTQADDQRLRPVPFDIAEYRALRRRTPRRSPG
ncbi:MAG TPA: peptidase E [Capillimicrobium sp.]|nr:peptidase E [Capillimicrobium sp.]